MEPVPQKVVRGWFAGLVYLGVVFASGCVTTAELLPGHEAPPAGKVAQVHATFHNQVIFSPDPANGGANGPGLAGRLYLFGPDMGYPLVGDGAVVVDLFDPTQPGPDGKPKQLERWVLNKDLLQRCLRKDTIGWGYTLLLPWGTYRQDLAQVLIKVRYDAPKAPPIYANPITVVFNPVQDFQSARTSRPITTPAAPTGVMPASHSAPAH